MHKSAMLLLFLVPALCAKAQNTIGLPQVENYNNSMYPGGTQTWDIRQDAQGRMYFANNEGLLTYDGSYWKLYPQPNKTILRSIALYDSRIYAGGQDEIGYFAANAMGVLLYHSLKPLIPAQYSSFTDVWETEIFGNSVFFRTWDRIFEYRDGAIKVYPAEVGWEIMKKSGNRLIAQERKRGLMEFVNNQWQPLGPESAAPSFSISGLLVLGRDSILLSSLQQGLYLYHSGRLTRAGTDADPLFGKSQIYTLEELDSTEYVLGTTSQGCLVMDRNGQMIQQIARNDGLQNNNVLSVFLDKDHNLWAGLDNGISFIAYNTAIKYIKPGKPDELSGYSARVYRNKLYIATSDGAYYAPLSPSAKDLGFSKGDFKLIKNSAGQAWRFDEVNNQLLLGHHNGSYWIKQDAALRLTSNSGAWMFLPTSAVAPSQRVLVGTYGGLLMLDYVNGEFRNAGEIKGMNESLRFLALDNNNNLWASHPYRGVYRINLAPDGKSFTYTLYTEKNGLPSTLRNTVFRVKNRVVFATEKGIYEFDSSSNRFVHSPLLYTIFGAINIQYLVEDGDGDIWFCSGKKIGIVDFESGNRNPVVTYFPELTGKILSGFENIYPYNKENVFIASNTGIIHLNYHKYIIRKSSPGILVTQVRTIGKSDSLIYGGYAGSSAAVAQDNADEEALQFGHSSNSFQFEFSSPAFGLQRNIVYSYQLEGYDRGWSPPTTKTEKEYTNLPPGSYSFLVKAFDNLGQASEPARYRFVIRPAWYGTLWAYLLYALLLLALVYLVYRWQLQKFNRQQLHFEKEQARLKYIHHLEREKNEKEIIQLQNEKLINEMVYKNKELADVSMHLVERSEALIKIKDELQRLYRKTGGNHDVQHVLLLVNEIEKNNSNWEQFAAHFDEINNDFIKNLKLTYPQLTSTDLKVCTYLQLKLTSKEIAQLMNISVRGVEVSRYRLRKKLQLPTGQALTDFLSKIHQGTSSQPNA